ncbi:hypothetical protein PPYR_05330 [Photinus pyralis]|uniref:Transposase domain-containing protein n=1 Tax=Photinus pyralis TaxID=7054 RepID=A0A1Y1NAD3_PHOPY|nr:uncharacterized protein LOC116182720 isoform X1 [Photinus pyralis]XP_031359122.1 uncharacterized protein LOC116182720 isoform X1 [Photinus pyralis]KAB0790112.1 hypothetical protein PPYR_15569 [Photinus pyralis]KAB0800976.1 hypothetical protein PPYR_05330 [Photinus pyralis]
MASHSRYCKKYRYIKKQVENSVTSQSAELNQSDQECESHTQLYNTEIDKINPIIDTEQFCSSAGSSAYPPELPSTSTTFTVNSSFDDPIPVTETSGSQLCTVNLKERSSTFQNFIKSWAINKNVNLTQLSTLLQGVNRIIPELNLPKDARTILQTRRELKFNNLKSSKGTTSQFSYLGISYMLKEYLNDNYLQMRILENGYISLSFNVDGLPLFKSTNQQLWPILCRLHLKCANLKPFVVAIFCGDSKPFSLSEYLDEFIVELNYLLENGFRHYNVVIPVKVLCISSDAPARAFLKGIKGHNGFYGCERCVQKGNYINNRMVYLDTDSPLRNDFNFRRKLFPEHHVTESPLTRISSFNMVSGFPLDYMHLCCLGVMRKLLNYWIRGSTLQDMVRLRVNLRIQLSKRLEYYAKFMPNDFNRKSRSLNELDRFKAVEFRTILLYLGPIVLKNILSTKLYEHFLLFHCAMRVLLLPEFVDTEWINTAKEMLVHFVAQIKLLYGNEASIYNVHSLIHLADDCLYFKETLNEVSCFPFENYLGKLKYMLRRPNRPAAQICKRLSETSYINYDRLDNANSFVVHNNTISFPKFKISLNKKDCFVFLNSRNIFKITEIVDELYVAGFISSELKNLYDYPIPSSELGIYKFNAFSHIHMEIIPITQISGKCFVISQNGHFVGMILLHLIC